MTQNQQVSLDIKPSMFYQESVLYSIVSLITGSMVFQVSFRSDSWPLDENVSAVLLQVTTYYYLLLPTTTTTY